VAPLLLALFTFFWVTGFDVIYSTLDEAFDREHGIRSLPAALGRRKALAVAAVLHVLGLAALFALMQLDGGWYWPRVPHVMLGIIALLLVSEHWLARNVNLAFFKINVLVGFAVFGFVLAIFGGPRT
jgi:4-hydroxybenzoate polyprenyltransferase